MAADFRRTAARDSWMISLIVFEMIPPTIPE
jgi:hypothetical protein